MLGEGEACLGLQGQPEVRKKKVLGGGNRGLSPSGFESRADRQQGPSKEVEGRRSGRGGMLQGKEQGGGAGPHVASSAAPASASVKRVFW